ncbi:NAD(P)-binding domain-containing protein [Streptomyces sp. NPDC005500]|uniref:NAD(P)-binding domain-containing protein n=1 Tax=Streptomyces sp. NPDC005500 TaxID=3155007 RepID=UPI0033A4A8B0
MRYANQLDADIRTGRRVSEVRADGDGFALALEDGSRLPARAVVAATGSFGQPNRPTLSGLDSFTGTVLHVADDQAREPFAGQRIVVGGGNSAVQVQPNSHPRPRLPRQPGSDQVVHAAPTGRQRPALLAQGHRAGHRAARPLSARSRHHGGHRRRSIQSGSRCGCTRSPPDVHRHRGLRDDPGRWHSRGR